MDSEASNEAISFISDACVRRILNCLSCLLVLLRRVGVISGIGEYVVVDGIDRRVRVGASITIAMTIEHMIGAQHIIIKTM